MYVELSGSAVCMYVVCNMYTECLIRIYQSTKRSTY